MGNIRSVSKALERVAPGAQIAVTADPARIRAADRVVVPGQGAMPDCMRQLSASGAREAVIEAARARPFLGICIGMQMLFEHGEEGDTPGLGLLAGGVPRFPAARMAGLKVPHMGWNEVRQARPHALWAGIPSGERFYFVHSYYPAPADAHLGTHLTLDLGGQAKFGPDIEWLDIRTPAEIDWRVDPARADGFYAEVRRYWPGLPDGSLQPSYSGVRPKIHGPHEKAPDFRIDGPALHGVPGLVNLFGIESPGRTSLTYFRPFSTSLSSLASLLSGAMSKVWQRLDSATEASMPPSDKRNSTVLRTRSSRNWASGTENTLCSKSGDIDLTRVGLAMKAKIEQFREQVQNVE